MDIESTTKSFSNLKLNMANRNPNIQNWDPMRDAFFDPNFNTYREGPGANLEIGRHALNGRQGRKEVTGPFKLFVGNIPNHIDVEGLENVFRHCGQPFDIYRNTPAPNLPRTWGFVYFKSYQEAEFAICELNGKAPLHLKVEFARNADQDKELIHCQQEDDLHIEQSNGYPRSSLPQRPRGRGRGLLQIVPGESRVGSCSPKEEAAMEDLQHFYPYRGSRYDETNAVTMRGVRKTINAPFGPRSVAKGRAFFDRSHDNAPHGINVNATEQMDHINKVLPFIEIDHAVKEKERFMYYQKEYPEASVRGVCVACYAIATNYCQRCRDWYCSRKCQEDDWPRHRIRCTDISTEERQDEQDVASSFTDIQKDMSATSESHIPQVNSTKKSPNKSPNKQRNSMEKSFKKADSDRPSNKNKVNVTKRTHSDKEFKAKDEKKRDKKKNDSDNTVSLPKDDSEVNRISVINASIERKHSVDSPAASIKSFDHLPLFDIEEISSDEFVKVKIVVPVGSMDYWVQLFENEDKIIQLSSELRKCADSDVFNPVVGSYVIAKYENLWFRARVTALEPHLKVNYIDYGNEELCELSDLRALPEYAKDLKAQGIKIRLAPGTTPKQENLLEESILLVKSVGKAADGSILVHVKGETYEAIPDTCNGIIDDVKESSIPMQSILLLLKAGMSGFLHVHECDSSKDFIATIFCNEHVEQYRSLYSDEFTEECDKIPVEEYKPQVQDVVLAKSLAEGAWIRAFIIKVDESQYIVAACETGLVETVKEVKRLPKRYREIVMFAVQCSIKNYVKAQHADIIAVGNKFCFEVEDATSENACITLISVDGGTLCSLDVKEWTPPFHLYETLKSIELKNGLCVMTSFLSSRDVYVRPLTNAAVEGYNRILQDVSGYCFTAPVLSRPPRVGELLACKFSLDGNFYRARVQNVNEEGALVSYIDFGNTERVPLKNFTLLSEELRERTCLCVKVVLKDVVERPLNEEALNLLNDLSANEVELKVEVCGSTGNLVNLYTSDGTYVNMKLNKILEPVWKTSLEDEDTHPKGIFMYSDMPFDDIKLGSHVEFSIASSLTYNAIMAIPVDSRINRVLQTHLRSDIHEYCEQSKEKSYVPRSDELCLGKYNGVWYRGACMGTSGCITLMLIDAGFVVCIEHTDVRRITKDFTVIPAAAFYCEVKVEGDDKAKDVRDAMSEYFKIMRKITVKVLKRSRQGYVVSVPDLNAHLKTL